MQFMLKLRYAAMHEEGPTRYTDRPTIDEAVDAAVRWLRLHRNAHPGWSDRYDAWEVLIPNEENGFKVVASGTAIK